MLGIVIHLHLLIWIYRFWTFNNNLILLIFSKIFLLIWSVWFLLFINLILKTFFRTEYFRNVFLIYSIFTLKYGNILKIIDWFLNFKLFWYVLNIIKLWKIKRLLFYFNLEIARFICLKCHYFCIKFLNFTNITNFENIINVLISTLGMNWYVSLILIQTIRALFKTAHIQSCLH